MQASINWTLIIIVDADIRFLVIGDWGSGDDVQSSLANTMANYAKNLTVDFILSTGDNIYPWGIASVEDEQLNTKWRYVYNQTTLRDLPWYLTVGNHDHGLLDDGREMFQVILKFWTYRETTSLLSNPLI